MRSPRFSGAAAKQTLQKIEQDTGLKFFVALNSNLADVLRTKIEGATPPAPPPPEIQSISLADGQISLVLTGAVAKYTISATTNLESPQWSELLATNYPDLPFAFVDTNANLLQRFYRIQTQP